ncbi:hypothetical protein BU24DRAFT_454841 [Aaosphaeria arxii CBS 175.79]|uniref:C2H2-type domain-containing protein n=1 Tax=Aaosphaeria arxii CBS 175.79 TaxID=1450172 RepID=A0A6A5XCE2_9PLEO|nr:uncharacterized protein BU24DRAFT_454841 [Aaosphaeria arxii CBS 175.79]KAF2010477.1 hypothetical protein BU24DRAFT_454841 [Aaosphaeria arxii CBS 175.79]
MCIVISHPEKPTQSSLAAPSAPTHPIGSALDTYLPQENASNLRASAPVIPWTSTTQSRQDPSLTNHGPDHPMVFDHGQYYGNAYDNGTLNVNGSFPTDLNSLQNAEFPSLIGPHSIDFGLFDYQNSAQQEVNQVIYDSGLSNVDFTGHCTGSFDLNLDVPGGLNSGFPNVAYVNQQTFDYDTDFVASIADHSIPSGLDSSIFSDISASLEPASLPMFESYGQIQPYHDASQPSSQVLPGHSVEPSLNIGSDPFLQSQNDPSVRPQHGYQPLAIPQAAAVATRTHRNTNRRSSRQASGRFACSLCDEPCSRLADLQRHMKKHGPREFQCEFPGCEKAFYRKDKRSSHAKTHGSAFEAIVRG